MKRFASLIPFVLILVLMLSTNIAAADLDVTVTGDYLFGGSHKWESPYCEYKADASGFILSSDVTIFGPVGVNLSYTSLSHSNFEADHENQTKCSVPSGGSTVEGRYTDRDIAATYTFLVSDAVAFKALVGYTKPKLEIDYPVEGLTALTVEVTDGDSEPVEEYDSEYVENYDFRGFSFGGAVTVTPVEKLAVTASATYAPLKFDYEDRIHRGIHHAWEGDGNALDVRISAAYQVVEQVGIEAGYMLYNVDYKFKGETPEYTCKNSGFFLGARATF